MLFRSHCKLVPPSDECSQLLIGDHIFTCVVEHQDEFNTVAKSSKDYLWQVMKRIFKFSKSISCSFMTVRPPLVVEFACLPGPWRGKLTTRLIVTQSIGLSKAGFLIPTSQDYTWMHLSACCVDQFSLD